MALTDRDRRIIGTMVEIISRKSSNRGEVENSLHAIRKIMFERGVTLAEVIGGAAINETVEALARERDKWRRAAEKAQRDRTAPANAARTASADHYAAEVARIIKAIEREHRHISTDGIAGELTRRKVPTPSGKGAWTRVQVHRVMQRAGKWQ